MNDKRRGLGRGLGALIPTGPVGGSRPTDLLYGDAGAPNESSPVVAQRFTGNIAVQERSTTIPISHDRATPTGSEPLRPVPGAEFAELPIDSIRANPDQPRTVFDEDELAELVHSIREIGVLQPVVVRPIVQSSSSSVAAQTDPAGSSGDSSGPVRFELVMGERRWRASRAAGKASIPAIVRDTSDEFMLRDALLENLHRAQLNPLEEAAAYQQLLTDFGCTQEELASRIGRSRPQISNTIRLMKLPALVQRRVAAGVLSAGHARALLSLPDAAAMERAAQRVVAEGLSVRGTEELVAMGGVQEPATAPTRPRERDADLDALAGRLGDLLDTRVTIAAGKKRGRLTVEFAGTDDLHRILDRLGVGADD